MPCDELHINQNKVIKIGSMRVSPFRERAITRHGGVVKLSTPVEQIEVCDRMVCDVITSEGNIYHAKKAHVSDLDPKLTVSFDVERSLNP